MNKEMIEKTLSNGLKVYLYSDKNCKRTFASYTVNFGSLGYYDKFYYDDKEYHILPGIAHLLEHYLIEKSKKGNMLLEFKNRNLEFNGLTSSEQTTFYFIGIKDFYKNLEDLISFVDDPKFNENDLNTVKLAVIEELKSSLDNKYRIAYANNQHNLYSNFDAVPIDNSRIGSVESTNKITLDDLKVAYDAYYNTDNKFLVIGGNIDIDKTIKELETITSKLPKHENKLKEYDYGNEFKVRKEREVIKLRGEADFVVTSYKIKNTFEMPLLKLDLLLNIFIKLKRNYLIDTFDSLTKEGIILNGMGIDIDFFKDVFSICVSTESYDSNKFISILPKFFSLEGINLEDFELEKKNLIASELGSRDFIYNKLMNFSHGINFTKKLYEIETIKSVKFEDMCDIIKKIKLDTKTTTIIKNELE